MMLIYFMMDTRQANGGRKLQSSNGQLDLSFIQNDTGVCVPPAEGSGWAEKHPEVTLSISHRQVSTLMHFIISLLLFYRKKQKSSKETNSQRQQASSEKSVTSYIKQFSSHIQSPNSNEKKYTIN